MSIKGTIGTLLVVLVAVVALPAIVFAEPPVTMREYSGAQGGDVSIYVSELTPGTTYRMVIIDSKGGEVGFDVVAGSNGEAGELIAFGPVDPPGDYLVELRDKATGTVVASATFTLNPDRTFALPAPAVPGMPNTGGGGMANSDAFDMTLAGPLLVVAVLAVVTGTVTWRFRRT